MAVPVATEDEFEPGLAQPLFKIPVQVLGYEVARDGERFLVNSLDEREEAPVTVTLNWPSLLEP